MSERVADRESRLGLIVFRRHQAEVDVVTSVAERRARRRFTDGFKNGAVRLVLDEGKTIAQVDVADPRSMSICLCVAVDFSSEGASARHVGSEVTIAVFGTKKRQPDRVR
ncbi:MAG: hypothetical protein ABI321_11200 [Polyangia bacterium]